MDFNLPSKRVLSAPSRVKYAAMPGCTAPTSASAISASTVIVFVCASVTSVGLSCTAFTVCPFSTATEITTPSIGAVTLV